MKIPHVTCSLPFCFYLLETQKQQIAVMSDEKFNKYSKNVIKKGWLDDLHLFERITFR